MATRAKGLWAFGLTSAAALWCAAMIPVAGLGPAYVSETHVDDSERGVYSYTSTSSLVEENGTAILGILAVPLVFVLVSWFALHRKCSRGSSWSDPVAWSAIIGLGLLAMIASASVGGFFLPAVALLCVAAAITPRS
jgi:hypothetical protein